MRRDAVLSLLKEHKAELEALGVAHASLFGSVARDEANDQSDIDLFITPALPRFSLIHLARVKKFLQDLLGRRADVFTTNGTSRPSLFKDIVKPDLIEIF